MATINVTDSFGLNEDLTIPDAASLGKGGLKHLESAVTELATCFNQPVDKAPFTRALLGATVTSPDLLSGPLPTLVMTAGTNAAVTIATAAAKSLFGDADFSPAITIAPGQAWVGFELDVATTLKAGATLGAVGVKLAAGAKLTTTSYLRFATTGAAPLPLLGEALRQTLASFSITSSAAGVRGQGVGTVSRTEVSGTIKASITWNMPFSVNALATADLPLNTTIAMQPNVTVSLTGSLEISGDFVTRCWKDTAEVVQVGVYKQRGSTLKASLNAGADVEVDKGSTDLLGTVLNKVLPGVDAAKAGLSPADAATLNDALKEGLDRTLGAQLNATCSAAYCDEAAVVYEVRLDQGDSAATDAALDQALRGDWSGLARMAAQAGSNVRPIRDITVQTEERKFTATVNLFGVLSATSLTDYVKKTTILCDEQGQLSMIDKVDASRISAAAEPYAADTEKLLKALMQDFVFTASYALVAGKLGTTLSVTQSYLDYARNMGVEEVEENLMLGSELGLFAPGSLDGELTKAGRFSHALFSARVSYDMDALMSLFFAAPPATAPRDRDELEKSARQVMATFLEYDGSSIADLRRTVLGDDAVWKDMNSIGNASQWSTIEGFPKMSDGNLNVIYTDWAVIHWWSGAIVTAAKALKTTLEAAAAAGPDPRTNQAFMNARAGLIKALGHIAALSADANTAEWGAAAMFVATGRHGKAMMDATWNSVTTHFGPANV